MSRSEARVCLDTYRWITEVQVRMTQSQSVAEFVQQSRLSIEDTSCSRILGKRAKRAAVPNHADLFVPHCHGQLCSGLKARVVWVVKVADSYLNCRLGAVEARRMHYRVRPDQGEININSLRAEAGYDFAAP